MQKKIHPKYFPNATAICACGRSYVIGSTEEKIQVEICAGCHPFYSGSEKIIDTAGRVEKFKARVRAHADRKTKVKAADNKLAQNPAAAETPAKTS